MMNPPCIVDGCERPSRSKTAALCPMHYHRQYRHGSVERTAHGSGIGRTGQRYKRVHWAAHPLADKYGRLWEHRAVLYNKVGAEGVWCHYCGRDLYWDLPKSHRQAVQADHLNAVRDDNRPENLVPCCRRCNIARGQARRHAALVAAGWWSANDTIAGLQSGGRSVNVDQFVAYSK